jgi:predicted DNA-binding antitoxin AbrB/MazE fold protein
MRKTLEAIYENGVLRPLEPLDLHEHQHVMVVVSELSPDTAIEELLDLEYLQACAREADHGISLDPYFAVHDLRTISRHSLIGRSAAKLIASSNGFLPPLVPG